jgi:hypothetical protein
MLLNKKAPAGCTPLLSFLTLLLSCNKESNPGPPPVGDPCAGKTINITATTAPSEPCGTGTGTITVSASGSTGFTYKLTGTGAYQASGVFDNVSAGSHTVFVKDAGGCEQSKAVTVAAGTAGPLFTAVKNLMAVTCQPCHNNTVQNGGMNWQADCNIVQFKARIKLRAVDEGSMPQGGPELSAAQKNIISNWINGGGKFTD